VPVNRPDSQLELFFEGVKRLVAAHRAFFILATRRRVNSSRLRRRDPIGGWYPSFYFSSDAEAERHALIAAFRKNRANYAHNPVTRALVAQSGTHRAIIQSALGLAPGDSPSSESAAPSNEVMEALGSSDRIIAACALSENLECYIGADRAAGTENFSPCDRDALLEFAVGAAPIFARQAMSRGLLDHQQPLTPRERDTLLLLLQDATENEMAEILGVTTQTAHQYVSRVYRKLAVNSRAQLSDGWMAVLDFVDLPENT
jgi:DNA-binding CsgD family transcriptional regulator